MKKWLWMGFLTVCSSMATAQTLYKMNDDGVAKWYYTAGDEFTSTTIDTVMWNSAYPWGRNLYCNQEQQYYSDWNNHKQYDGTLKLVVKKEELKRKVLDYEAADYQLKCNEISKGPNERTFAYSSGMLFSKQKYHYGYYEIRFRAPEGKGYWPAFWLYAGVQNEEIDIFEIKGERNSDLHVDVHCPAGCNNYKTTLGLLRKNWGDYLRANAGWHNGFNVVGLEWKPGYLVWYLNGEGIAYWKGNFTNPMWVIANLAIPSNDGPFGPGPDPSTRFPANFEIDYIRIYGTTPSGNSADFVAPNTKGSAKLAKGKRPEYKPSRLKQETLFATLSQHDNKCDIQISGAPKGNFRIDVITPDGKAWYTSTDKASAWHSFQKPPKGSRLRIISDKLKLDELISD